MGKKKRKLFMAFWDISSDTFSLHFLVGLLFVELEGSFGYLKFLILFGSFLVQRSFFFAALVVLFCFMILILISDS